jgi:hemolysin activation/secretion protein
MKSGGGFSLNRVLRSVALLALASAPVWGVAQTEVPPAAPIQFNISAYKVIGNTLLHPRRVETITAQHVGPSSDFETIQRAVEALEQAYVNAGYGSVKVEVPEQELESGVVTLQVVQGKLGQVTVEANPFYDAANLRHALPALVEGEVVNTRELNRNLQLANETGSKVTSVTFKRGDDNSGLDVAVKVLAEDPQRWLALLDNTGTPATGEYRVGLVYQHANLFNRDHALSVQVMSSPAHWQQVAVLGLGYRIPFYEWGGALDLNASHSTVDSGRVAQAGGGPDLLISGSGTTFGVRYTHNLDGTADSTHKISLGLEQRLTDNNVTLGGSASLVPNLATRPLTLGYSGQWHDDVRDLSLGGTYLHNLPGGRNGDTADYNQPGGRVGAVAPFNTLKYNLQLTQRLASRWGLRLGLSGQASRDLLIASEQFGVGGTDSVRGFGEREVAGDQGWRLGLEVLAPPVDADQWRLTPLVFVETATVSRNQPAPGEIPEQTIAGAGLGLRASYARQMSLRLDWGFATQGVAGTAGTQTGHQRVHASMVWLFK